MFNEENEFNDVLGGVVLKYNGINYSTNFNSFDFTFFTYANEPVMIQGSITKGSKITSIQIPNENEDLFLNWQNNIAFVRRLHNAHTAKERGMINFD
jgi:hypothetical protein